MAAVSDATSLAPATDGVLFVVRAQRTSTRVARAALELLYQRRINVLGLVFNAVEANAAEYYYCWCTRIITRILPSEMPEQVGFPQPVYEMVLPPFTAQA